jgi:hypothetical protein
MSLSNSIYNASDTQQLITKLKPYPISCKQHQPSETPIIELLCSSSSKDSEVEPDRYGNLKPASNDSIVNNINNR